MCLPAYVTADLNPSRGDAIIKFLMANPKKSYSKKQLDEEFHFGPSGTKRAIEWLMPFGVLVVDKTYGLARYSYKVGSQPAIFKPFKFEDEPQTEIGVREQANELFARTKLDWKLLEVPAGAHLIYGMLFGLALEEIEDAARYERFVEAVAAKTRNAYVAYRMALTIKKLPRQKRAKYLEELGIQWRREDADGLIDMALIYRDAFMTTEWTES